ncbi:hypothetical protein DSO57_1001157 [Entomophthora muscae]|uniref:Uncharacterized protein n=2 Tax=Entomophthora muscae TaxID=34485 RepID=A0ACC2S0E2_9FUNG|nr:hypothetical protein DSO57_1001156 [Entomophthora muscae]KAJ9055719.1 hypothetical protein DSO57_1001157 [Entomophthora muscae]
MGSIKDSWRELGVNQYKGDAAQPENVSKKFKMQAFNLISALLTLTAASALQGGEHRGDSGHHADSDHGNIGHRSNSRSDGRGYGRNGQYDDIPQYCVDFYDNTYGSNPYSDAPNSYANFQTPPSGCPFPIGI